MPIIIILLLTTFLLHQSQCQPNPDPCHSLPTSTPLSLLNHDPNKLTVLISGYSPHRIPLLLSLTRTYSLLPFISTILVLWSNPSTPLSLLHSLSSNLTSLSPSTHIRLIRHPTPSLNSRFFPHPYISTRAVLVCDDDVEVDPQTVLFSFQTLQNNPDRLIGLFPRSHGLDLPSKRWIYTVHPDKYSIILTKFMLLKIEYLYLYTCGVRGLKKEYKMLRGVVDRVNNCEDILMNFLVADVGGWAPVLVKGNKVRDYGDARNDDVEEGEGGLSGVRRGKGEHRKKRGECIGLFHKVLGRVPLRYGVGMVVDRVKDQGLCQKSGKLVPCDQQVVV